MRPPVLSIGWVIFWKCVTLGAWAGIVERWQFCKKRSREAGMELRYDKRTGAYVSYCPYERAERLLRIAAWVIGVPVVALTAFTAYVFVTA
jgi:hypothetical protein